MSVPDVTMAKGGGGGKDFGAGSSLGAVMERSKLSFAMPTPPQQAPKLDDSGSGGDNGKNLHNGGGGGGGDDDDDDDYFGEGDDEGGDGSGGGGGGDGFFRTAIPELFDRLSIGAVLQEWHKTILDLPLFIRRAVEMGLFSSAQLVRFLSVDVRPGITRGVSRALPPSVSALAVCMLMYFGGAGGREAAGCWGRLSGGACMHASAHVAAAQPLVCGGSESACMRLTGCGRQRACNPVLHLQ